MTTRSHPPVVHDTHHAAAPASSPTPPARPSIAQRHPASVYVALAIGLSWGVWIPALLHSPDTLWPLYLGAFGPAGAGAIMVRAHGGRVRAWLRGMAIFRVRLRWYAVALCLPLIEPMLQALLAARAGVPLAPGALVERLPLVAMGFVLTLLVGGGQEEPGWRGWLLPRLQSRGMSGLAAGLLVGVAWAAWHLPLYVIGPYQDLSFGLYVPWVVAASVVFTWLHNTTGGSVVLAMLLHAQVNTVKNLVPVAEAAELETVYGGSGYVMSVQIAMAAAYIAVAAGLVARYGTRLGAPQRRSREAVGSHAEAR